MLIALIAFVGIFLSVALLLLAREVGSSQSEQAAAHLQTALSVKIASKPERQVNILKTGVVSAIPWIDQNLRSLKIADGLGLFLYQANLRWSAGTFVLAVFACFFLAVNAVNAKAGNLLVAILVGLLCACLPIAFVRYRRGKRFEAFEEALPEALSLMVNGLRAGHSLVSVLRVVGQELPDPIGAEFRVCFEEQNYGVELRTAMENMANRFPLQDLRIAITAMLIQKESGGNLAEVLDKTAAIIRERFQLKREVRTHTAQGRLTGWILTLLPLVLGMVLFVVDPEMISVLWTRRIGQELLMLSGAMTVIGGFVIRKIVNMEV